MEETTRKNWRKSLGGVWPVACYIVLHDRHESLSFDANIDKHADADFKGGSSQRPTKGTYKFKI